MPLDANTYKLNFGHNIKYDYIAQNTSFQTHKDVTLEF